MRTDPDHGRRKKKPLSSKPGAGRSRLRSGCEADLRWSVANDPRAIIARIGPASFASAEALHEQGIELECAGEIDRAIEAYRLALQVGGPDEQVLFDLAYALDLRGDYAAAAERYRQVLESNPCHVDAWINLAESLLSNSEPEAAFAAFRRAVALAPTDPCLRHNLEGLLRVEPSSQWPTSAST